MIHYNVLWYTAMVRYQNLQQYPRIYQNGRKCTTEEYSNEEVLCTKFIGQRKGFELVSFEQSELRSLAGPFQRGWICMSYLKIPFAWLLSPRFWILSGICRLTYGSEGISPPNFRELHERSRSWYTPSPTWSSLWTAMRFALPCLG